MSPTVLLYIFTAFPYMAVVTACMMNPSWVHSIWVVPIFLFQAFMVFLLFTPLHDSAHKIASKNIWINNLVMYGCWPMFLNCPRLFRSVHIIHHAHTNDPKEDPDHFTAGKYLAARWGKSFLMVFNYNWFYFSRCRKSFWDTVEMVFSGTLPFALGYIFTHFGLGSVYVWAWLLPSFVGIGFLAYTNTSWPHHPANERDPILNTVNHEVPVWLRYILFNQNYHLVHHLQPTLPWYEYVTWWNDHKLRLTSRGAKTLPFLISKSSS